MRRIRAGKPQFGKRLPHSLRRLLAQSVAEIDDQLRQRHPLAERRIAERRIGDGIGAQMHALGRAALLIGATPGISDFGFRIFLAAGESLRAPRILAFGFRADDQILIHPLGQERDDRGQELRQRDEHGVQRLIGGQLVAVAGGARPPEPAAVAADVPVRQVVDEGRRLAQEVRPC